MRIGVVLMLAAVLCLFSCSREVPSELSFDPLPYAYDALEPYIDAQTMEVHYERHHRGYFNKLVEAVKGTSYAGKSLEDILAGADRLPAAVRNNAGGHYNHTLFWTVLSPQGGGLPQGLLAEKLKTDFGSFEKFQEIFNQAALSRFGSGWAWLCVAKDGSLFVTSTPNQDNPLMADVEKTGIPILGLDVWEHAYYLQYQNQRSQYIDAFWHVVNWPEVTARLEKALAPR